MRPGVWAVIEVGVTVTLIVMTIARLAWVESSKSSRTYSSWHRRYTLDLSIVLFTVLFAGVTLYRFLVGG